MAKQLKKDDKMTVRSVRIYDRQWEALEKHGDKPGVDRDVSYLIRQAIDEFLAGVKK